MFERFGEFDSAEELNELAVSLRREGDRNSLLELAGENGIDAEIAEAFMEGNVLYLCDTMMAAIGKIEIEAKELKLKEIMEDWTEYLKAKCFEDNNIAVAVRSKNKSLRGCIAALLKWSFKNQISVDKEIIKAAGLSANKVTMGIPGMGQAKQIITEYYLGRVTMK